MCQITRVRRVHLAHAIRPIITPHSLYKNNGKMQRNYRGITWTDDIIEPTYDSEIIIRYFFIFVLPFRIIDCAHLCIKRLRSSGVGKRQQVL